MPGTTTRIARRLAPSLLFALAAFGPTRTSAVADDEDAALKSLRRIDPSMTPWKRDDLARRNGRLEIRGPTRLRGAVLASEIHVAPGADVEYDDDLVLYSTGSIRIEAPIRPAPAAKSLTKGKSIFGAKGAKGKLLAVAAVADITVDAALIGDPGENGESVSGAAFAFGGWGGDGGPIDIRSDVKGGTITINAAILPGLGGDGGSAVAFAGVGPASAFGGNGGKSGDVSIRATNVVFNLGGYVDLPPPSRGGDATASAGKGTSATVPCYAGAAVAGGLARAEGGDSGSSGTVLVIGRESIQPAGPAANFFIQSSLAPSRAGDAHAIGGDGTSAVQSTCIDRLCPARGLRGTSGGRGGDAKALGGHGAAGMRVFWIDGGALVDPPNIEGPPSGGGFAFAFAGSGGDGHDGETAKSPGRGGAGGNTGTAKATGGDGGRCAFGRGPSGAPIRGGDGGDAHVNEAPLTPHPGAGGDGGDCCQRPGGLGAAGGKAGLPKSGAATPGKGGVCKGGDGVSGAPFSGVVPTAADGAKGADCPPPVAKTFTVSTDKVTITSSIGADGSVTIHVTNTSDQPQTLDVGKLTGHFFDFPNGQVAFGPGETKDIAVGHSSPSAVTEVAHLILKLLDGTVQADVKVTGVTK